MMRTAFAFGAGDGFHESPTSDLHADAHGLFDLRGGPVVALQPHRASRQRWVSAQFAQARASDPSGPLLSSILAMRGESGVAIKEGIPDLRGETH